MKINTSSIKVHYCIPDLCDMECPNISSNDKYRRPWCHLCNSPLDVVAPIDSNRFGPIAFQRCNDCVHNLPISRKPGG